MIKVLAGLALAAAALSAQSTTHENIDDIFYDTFVKTAPNAKPVLVRDTESALGRYDRYPKALGIKTLALAHGHLCDGLVLAYVELANTLPKLFDDGVIDRTDIRVVAKNSPCLVDTAALMSGARINFRTLSLDNRLGGSFIVQRISTGETYKVALADKRFLKALKTKEEAIKTKQKRHQTVTPQDIDEVESLAFSAMRHMLGTDPKKLLNITKLEGYEYRFRLDDIGTRSDVLNKNVGR